MCYSMVFFCKQKTAYEMRISDCSTDVCSSDLQRSNDAARTVDRPRAPSRPGRHVFATHDIQEQATRMANPKPDARTRFRRSTRDGADGSTQRRLTSDRISADLADFQKAGGQVEVLGVTRVLRAEERRVGKEGVSTCRSRCAQSH